MLGCWYTACRERRELDRRVGLSPSRWWWCGCWRWEREEVEGEEEEAMLVGMGKTEVTEWERPLPRDGGRVDVVAEGTVLREARECC
jgi:hypothetical protein